MDIKRLPCPFCKSEELLQPIISGLTISIICNNCEASGPKIFASYEEIFTSPEDYKKIVKKAYKQWNKRK